MTDRPLALLHAGLVSGVGLSAATTCAATRCAIDNFRETRFVDRAGKWIIGSSVPLPTPWRGRALLVHMLAMSISECLEHAGSPDSSTIPLLLCVAEGTRPGRLDGLDEHLLLELERTLALRFHPLHSKVLALGRMGAGIAMAHARKLVYEHQVPLVLIAATDSMLVAATLSAYELADRVQTSQNSNGFVPGEAAGALIVGRFFPAVTGTVACIGSGFGREAASIESRDPFRADGLTEAFREALVAAGITMAEVGYRVSSMNGEQYWFKECDLATTRLLRGRHEFMDLWHPASSIGETGATAMLAGLIIAMTAAKKGYAAGNPVLVAASNDDGYCAALILLSGDMP